jgi:GT2 family glycosyltransferase
MVQIAVLITCHNRRENTLLCLKKLLSQHGVDTDYKVSVYLVDDGSSDETGLAVQEAFPRVNVIAGNGDLYWNRGMHTAWKQAEKTKYDFFLWLNDDTYLFEETVQELLKSAALTNNQAIICGNTCSIDNHDRITYGGIHFKQGLLKPNGRLQKCDYFQGNCVLIPHAVYEKVGKLDPFFHHAIGDLDYGLRAKSQKVDAYIAPRIAGTCETHETLPKWCLDTVPFIDRLKNLYSPLGNSHPYYYLRFVYRHYGLFTAVKHLLSIHLRVSIPSLWKK